MCGIAGIFQRRGGPTVDERLLQAMCRPLEPRGPDAYGQFLEPNLALGIRRLAIIDLETGDQPFFNEDRSVVSVCNGEIFNYRELRAGLEAKGHRFRSRCDVEVLPHLYEQYGINFVSELNGQFAFALFDRAEQRLFLARDHVGIAPLFYTQVGESLVFASEVKALLEHPGVPRSVHLTGLDQILCFPGIVSPHTAFENIHALKPGHHLCIESDRTQHVRYWDMAYPKGDGEGNPTPEKNYIERLEEALSRSVKLRLQADVPVGFYLSGGLDSSLIGALIKKCSNEPRHSFSIGFTETSIDERRHQRLMAEQLGSLHHEILFDWQHISDRLEEAVYRAETPLKETYNTCSLALSSAVRDQNIKVVLTGEGADELFAGYVGYRFDKKRSERQEELLPSPEKYLEDQIREHLWGTPDFFYEKEQHAFRDVRRALYSEAALERFQDFDALDSEPVDKTLLKGRHPVHLRSYLDFKLRLSDHLLADHGDRVAYANSVEARYPLLDLDVLELAKEIPPNLKLNGWVEKYILKRIGEQHLPATITEREKFSFVAPGSPFLIQQSIPWVQDLLSFERIQRQGYFNPNAVERLKKRYSSEGFRLNVPFETDLLIVVLTFGLLLDLFDLPNLH